MTGPSHERVAVELPKEDSYDYTACCSGVNNMITFSKNHTASSYEMIGTTRSNPPDGMFDKNTFRCVGMSASLDVKFTGSTVCEAVDVDGDKRLADFSLASDGSLTRENAAGTGKYEGMKTVGTVHPGSVSGDQGWKHPRLQSPDQHVQAKVRWNEN